MIFYKGTSLDKYIDFYLTNRLKGIFHIYKNSENKFHYKSDKSLNPIDLNFWTYIKTIKL